MSGQCQIKAPLVVEQCWCLSLKELFQGWREPFQVGTKMLFPFITFLVKRQSQSKLSFYEDLLSNYVFHEQLVLTITRVLLLLPVWKKVNIFLMEGLGP